MSTQRLSTISKLSGLIALSMWMPLVTAAQITPAAQKRAQILLERAAKTMGGDRLDQLASIQVIGTWPSRSGPLSKVAVYLFPDRMRRDLMTPMGWMNTVVVTPAECFAIGEGERIRVMKPQDRLPAEQHFQRQPVWLLRARHAPGFLAYVSGTENKEQVAVENVAVEFAGLHVTLGIDPASGRVLRLAYRESTGPNTFGAYEEFFSDFRVVDGIEFPFHVAGTVEGQPSPGLGWEVQSVRVNAAVDRKLFEKPSTAGQP